jgi:hypothetical protein
MRFTNKSTEYESHNTLRKNQGLDKAIISWSHKGHLCDICAQVNLAKTI